MADNRSAYDRLSPMLPARDGKRAPRNEAMTGFWLVAIGILLLLGLLLLAGLFLWMIYQMSRF